MKSRWSKALQKEGSVVINLMQSLNLVENMAMDGARSLTGGIVCVGVFVAMMSCGCLTGNAAIEISLEEALNLK